ncbi:MAG: SDR family NAD(P)-dependent oxidoreductase [Candidatus Nanopelagicales bacterium]|nr:SDR family NAD(P)-dependent oxidoreductase [Candidatus Nanopelagicales bacterium]
MSTAFSAQSTTDEVLDDVDLTGRRYLVTGVSAGLGVETTRALLAHGASVVGTARDLAKAERALTEVRTAVHPGATLDVIEVDLASLASVRAGADAILARGETFDALIANAGVMACPFGTTADGFETQFGTNHLGHFVLVNRLLPLVKTPGRIVMLSSAAHRRSDVSLDDPGFATTEYDPWVSYGRSKTANVLFAVALDERLRGTGIRATALHPGGIDTELGRHMDPKVIEAMRASAAASSPGGAQSLRKSVPQGAATTVWAACVAEPDAIGGRFLEDCNVASVNDTPAMGGVKGYALDADTAAALWTLSEEMTGEQFTVPPAAG